jgi:hypothetical protein
MLEIVEVIKARWDVGGWLKKDKEIIFREQDL